MAEQLYKVRQKKKPFDMINGEEFNGAKFCRITVEKPNPRSPKGEWYCMTSECIVRECTVHCKTEGEPLPKMWCPVCGETMQFKQWLGSEMLVPVKPGEA